MHESNILKIKIETEKIVQQALTINKNEEFKRILENEGDKLKNLEFIISIVGTVKAGKSTTINAIVGQEILPNRAYPMTTLPTLVTHKKGQVEPKLTMPKYETLNKFLNQVREKLKKDSNGEFSKDSHGKEIIKTISDKNLRFKEIYQGKDNIYIFLQTLNDLMRLAKDIKLTPPYKEFEKINELPRIEIEFYYLNHLEDMSNTRLSLLDTPGPDEFGHSEELKNIFRTQLKQSSAIMLVMNYTVINNEGAGKTREEVKEIRNLIKDEHLFVLVNKFDEKTSKDPDYENTKQNISKSMFDGKLKVENIFPISARLAYLVNIARRELSLKGKINKTIPWVEDFGDKILGRKWENQIENITEIEEACAEAWKDSYFKKPLDKIIIHGYSNSAFESLGGILHKIEEINRILSNTFKTRESSLNEDIQKLKQNIENLGNQAIILSTEREDLLNTQFSYHSNKQNLIIMQNNQCISVNNITAVFCLSPLYTRKGFISSNEKDFWHFTWREALYGFYARLSQRAYFVNKNIPTALFAQNKIQFFDVARKANINTPDTWIGNKTQDINEFFDNYDKVVIKTMHQIYLEHQDEQAMFLVKPVNKSQFHNFNSQNECPVFLQQAIDKLFDVRAIIIGKKVIGCKIDASLSKVGNLDWRAYDLPNTIHEPFELPNKVQGKLLNILKYFNLDYACLDLCVDKHGEFWLLDVNPFGRYMWIELSVGIDISNEIAKFLISKSTLNSNVKN